MRPAASEGGAGPLVIPFAQYRAIDAVNWSTLKELSESPRRYRWRLENPRPDTPATRLGRAVHTSVLEPDEFPRRYVVQPEGEPDPSLHRGKKEGRARWAEWLAAHPEDAEIDADAYRRKVFAAEHPGQEILTDADYQHCIAVRNVVRAHPECMRYLAAGRAEVTLVWTDPETGIRCKARADWWPSNVRGVFNELKTARRIGLHAFASQAESLGYFGGSAWYRRGFKALGYDLSPVFIVAQTTDELDAAVFIPDGGDLMACDEDISSSLMRLAEHRRRNEWPGRYPEPQPLKRPRWAYPQDVDGEIEYPEE